MASNMSLIRLALTGSPTSSGTIWVIDGITGRPACSKICLQLRSRGLLRLALLDDDFEVRTLARRPATSTGDSEVVKMKPGA